MKNLLNSTINDAKSVMIIVIALLVVGAIFTSLKKSSDPETVEVMEGIEKSTYDSFEIILWGLGIAGTMGLVFLLVNYFRNNNFI